MVPKMTDPVIHRIEKMKKIFPLTELSRIQTSFCEKGSMAELEASDLLLMPLCKRECVMLVNNNLIQGYHVLSPINKARWVKIRQRLNNKLTMLKDIRRCRNGI